MYRQFTRKIEFDEKVRKLMTYIFWLLMWFARNKLVSAHDKAINKKI